MIIYKNNIWKKKNLEPRDSLLEKTTENNGPAPVATLAPFPPSPLLAARFFDLYETRRGTHPHLPTQNTSAVCRPPLFIIRSSVGRGEGQGPSRPLRPFVSAGSLAFLMSYLCLINPLPDVRSGMSTHQPNTYSRSWFWLIDFHHSVIKSQDYSLCLNTLKS